MSKLETDAIEPSTGNTLAIGAAGDTVNLSNATVNLPAASVTAHVTQFDDLQIRKDIATLALHNAISRDLAANTMGQSWVDTFEDATGIDATTTCSSRTLRNLVSRRPLCGNQPVNLQ